MNAKTLYIRFFIAFLVWAGLSVLGYFHGIKLIKLFEPYYVAVVETAHPNYEARIDYDDNPTEPYIELYVTAVKPIPYAPGKAVPAGQTIGPTKITTFHTMVPLIIFAVIVLVWPVKSVAEYLLLLAIAIPGLLIVTGVTSPFQMLGLLDTAFISAAAQIGYEYESGAFAWMKFTEGGARWLIPVLTAILCGWIANRVGRRWAKSQKSA